MRASIFIYIVHKIRVKRQRILRRDVRLQRKIIRVVVLLCYSVFFSSHNHNANCILNACARTHEMVKLNLIYGCQSILSAQYFFSVKTTNKLLNTMMLCIIVACLPATMYHLYVWVWWWWCTVQTMHANGMRIDMVYLYKRMWETSKKCISEVGAGAKCAAHI